jgi:hypothetical protein
VNNACAIGVFSLLTFATATASAEYVCSVTYDIAASNLGTNGGVSVAVHAGPNCTGTSIGVKRFCTSGGTNVGCAAGVTLSRAALLQVYASLVDAAAWDLKVSGQTATCNGGRDGCWSNLSFFSN